MTTLELLTNPLLQLGLIESPSAGLTMARVIAIAPDGHLERRVYRKIEERKEAKHKG